MSYGSIDEFYKQYSDKKKELKGILPRISAYGDFQPIEDIDVVLKRVMNILVTSKRTYIFEPDYGAPIYKFIFEPADEKTLEQLDELILEVIQLNKGDADMSHEVLFFRNKKGFRIVLSIDYKGQKKKVNLDIDESLLSTVDY